MLDACRIVGGLTALLLACGAGVVAAAEEPTPRAPVAFEPGDISIGEPIALPFATPTVSRADAPAGQPAATTVPMSAVPMSTVPSAALAPLPAAAGTVPNGWLGMAVAESSVPGRWSIVEVVPTGPAAEVGIRPGDELRAINGTPLRSADEVSQALTAIASGQNVRLSVARADQVSDIVLAAIPRPAMAAAREPQPAQVDMAPTHPVQPLAVLPSVSIPPPATALAPPPATASVLVSPPPTPPTVPSQPAPPADAASPAAVVAEPSAPPPAPPPARPSASRGRTALGVRTMPIDQGMQARFRLPQAAGAYVVGVVGDLPASKAGIPPGSVIVSLGDRPVRTPQELSQLVNAGPIDRPVSLQYVLPGGAEKRAEVVLQSLERPLEQALVGDDAMQSVAAPTFVPGPAAPSRTGRTAQRPVATSSAEVGELRREALRLRSLLEGLERRLERLSQ
jgi:membrane-associated protease RseP (regulator of RpoE activity)